MRRRVCGGVEVGGASKGCACNRCPLVTQHARREEGVSLPPTLPPTVNYEPKIDVETLLYIAGSRSGLCNRK